MPGLTRTSARLLYTVDHKPHATDEDHDKSNGLPSPPATSSTESLPPRSRPTSRNVPAVLDHDRSPVSSDEEVEIRPAPRVSDLTRLSSKDKTGAKTTRPVKRKAGDSDSDELFSDLGRASQRQRTTKQGAKFKRLTYGSSQAKSSQEKPVGKTVFKKVEAVEQTPVRQQAAFKSAGDANVFQFTAGSDPASPPSSMEIIDMTGLDSTPQASKPLTVRCTVCTVDVDLLLKQEYDDEFRSGSNIRRQNAFCRFHTQHDARQLWKARSYPVIDWAKLDKRMLKRHPRLKKIISGGVGSSFREALTHQIADRGKTGGGKRAEDRIDNASAGYYGPRGQKVMSEHITTTLARELGEASRSDPLILAAGKDAGLAGFVQQVLVPELATELIMEDMRLGREAAVKLLAESKEIGEILNEEERDVVLEELDADATAH